MKNYLIVFVILAIMGCSSDDGIIQPENVNLIFPLQDEVCEEGINTVGDKSRIFFEWEDAENAQYYDLVVNDLENGENFIVYEEIYDNRKELELVHNRPYQWYVISKHSQSDLTGKSPRWNFFFVGEPQANYAPFPANILAPEFNSEISLSQGTLNLQWQTSDPDSESLTYTVFLDMIDGKQEPSEELSNLETNSVNINLTVTGTFYWRVESYDGLNKSYSQVYRFNVNE